jgi:hypothetical protein
MDSMMGTNTLSVKNLFARSIAVIAILALCTSSPTECAAVQFGFLVADSDQDSDDLALNSEAEQDEESENNDQDTVDDDNLFGSDLDRNRNPEAGVFPEVTDGRFILPPLEAITTATDKIGNGRTPDSFREELNANRVPLPESAGERGIPWNWSVAQWEASNNFSYPLYFEDRMLERHGHAKWGYLQPAASGVRFVGSMVALPYLTTVKAPCDCEYKLGHYRSGSCAPVMLQRPPWERCAAVVEALAIGGGIAIFP